MATFTLNDIKAEVERKYAPTVIKAGKETYTFPNLLQMPGAKSKEVLAIIDEFEALEGANIDEQVAILRKVIIAAEKDSKGEKLLEEIGDNPAVVIEIATSWMGSTQVGEA